jgi:hypothetical protein
MIAMFNKAQQPASNCFLNCLWANQILYRKLICRSVATIHEISLSFEMSRFCRVKVNPWKSQPGHLSAPLSNFESPQRREHAREMVPHTSGAEFEVRDSLLLLPVIDSPCRNIDRSCELKALEQRQMIDCACGVVCFFR